MRTFPRYPERDDVLNVKAPHNRFTKQWLDWIQALIDGMNSRAEVIGYEQRYAATTGFTAVPVVTIPKEPTLIGGLYRVSGHIAVLSASSGASLPGDFVGRLSVTWTCSGATQTTIIGNIATAPLPSITHGICATVRCDPGSVLTFTAAFSSASVPGLTIVWDLDVVVEAVR